jgi:hypothetical protein
VLMGQQHPLAQFHRIMAEAWSPPGISVLPLKGRQPFPFIPPPDLKIAPATGRQIAGLHHRVPKIAVVFVKAVGPCFDSRCEY